MIGIKYDDKFTIINPLKVLYFISNQKNTEIFLKNGKKIISRLPIEHIEKQMNSNIFFIINNKTLINIKEVDAFIQKGALWVAIMEDKKEIKVDASKIRLFKKRYIVV